MSWRSATVDLLPLAPSGRAQSDLAQDPLVLTPLGSDANVQIQIDVRTEEPFQFFPRRDADLLDHGAASPDDDRLLRFAIHDDGAIQPQQPFPAAPALPHIGALLVPSALLARVLVEPIDDDGARVGNLVAGE